MLKIIQVTNKIFFISLLIGSLNHLYGQELYQQYFINKSDTLQIINSRKQVVMDVIDSDSKYHVIPRNRKDYIKNQIKSTDNLIKEISYNDSLKKYSIKYHKNFTDSSGVVRLTIKRFGFGDTYLTWFSNKGEKLKVIHITLGYYIENYYLNNILIKELIFSNEYGGINYYDSEEKLILSIDYESEKLPVGESYDYEKSEINTIVYF